MDLNKALKIGSGKTVVIEFTDPDCPYCRQGAAFFRNRTDVTRYVFFNPLPMHPQAKEKAQFILSSPDRAKAYEEVMSGRLDSSNLTGTTAEGIKRFEEQMAIVQEARVESTPIFIICGRIIQGFDQRKLEAALGK
jgi:thiol:disulfide interchange protein DsbC